MVVLRRFLTSWFLDNYMLIGLNCAKLMCSQCFIDTYNYVSVYEGATWPKDFDD